MKREFTITLDGTDYQVIAEGGTLTINGRPFTVEAVGDDTILVDGIGHVVRLDDGAATVDGSTHQVQVAGMRLAAAQRAERPSAALRPIRAGAGAIVAVMPGKIVRLLVEPGQRVQAGDPICVLEAMKMENELRAPHDGIVKAVHVRAGEDVEKNQVLVEVDAGAPG